MKKQSSSKSGFINTRNLLGVFLCLIGISLAMLTFGASGSGANLALQKPAKQAPVSKTSTPSAPVGPRVTAPLPTGGTLTSANIGSNNALNYADAVGSATNETFFAGMGTCAVPQSCSTYTLTIDPSVGTAVTGYD